MPDMTDATPTIEEMPTLIEALRSYQQADEDGVMVLVSRQACEEAAAALSSLSPLIEAARKLKSAPEVGRLGEWIDEWHEFQRTLSTFPTPAIEDVRPRSEWAAVNAANERDRDAAARMMQDVTKHVVKEHAAKLRAKDGAFPATDWRGRESKEATHRRFYEAFYDWFKNDGGCDFWSECDAPESLATIAVELHDKLCGPRPSGSRAADDVVEERRRQVEVEGWAPDHDDRHGDGQMASAAACYALSSAIFIRNGAADAEQQILDFWPWELRWWKPKSARRDLVRAGALILAEIERLDRASSAPPTTSDGTDK